MAKMRMFQQMKNEKGEEKLIAVDKTWEEVCDEQEALKKEFRDKNGTDKILALGRKDYRYDEYCNALQEFLDSVPLDDIDKQYRIPEAKRRREKGIFPK